MLPPDGDWHVPTLLSRVIEWINHIIWLLAVGLDRVLAKDWLWLRLR